MGMICPHHQALALRKTGAWRRVAALLAVCAGLASCNLDRAPGADPALNEAAAQNLAAVIRGDDAELVSRLSKDLNPETVKRQAGEVRAFLGEEAPPEPVVTGYNQTAGTKGRRYSVVQDYRFSDKTARLKTDFVKEGDEWRIVFFTVSTEPISKGEPKA
ncbi:hypothetical protein LTR94_022523 [Friedmanniomyces endolithicus]|nr:hypothetical protein LTR94_022523 [Friedmanniomyces endolithicus]